MRTLNRKQKKLVNDWFNQNWQGSGSIIGANDIPQDLYDTIEAANDHETLWQNLDRYINDLALEKIYS